MNTCSLDGLNHTVGCLVKKRVQMLAPECLSLSKSQPQAHPGWATFGKCPSSLSLPGKTGVTVIPTLQRVSAGLREGALGDVSECPPEP